MPSSIYAILPTFSNEIYRWETEIPCQRKDAIAWIQSSDAPSGDVRSMKVRNCCTPISHIFHVLFGSRLIKRISEEVKSKLLHWKLKLHKHHMKLKMTQKNLKYINSTLNSLPALTAFGPKRRKQLISFCCLEFSSTRKL